MKIAAFQFRGSADIQANLQALKRGIAAAALLGSGMLAGLAGSMEVSGVSYALFQSLSPGYGFTAIAVALLARLDPRAIVVAGILFAALETGAAGMQRDAGVPAASG